MGNTISIARKGLWGFHEEPRIKRRCVRRNPPPSTGTSTGGGNGSGGGTGSGSGSGTSTGGGGGNGGGNRSGSGSGSSGGSGSDSGSGSGSGRGGDSRSGTSQSGGGSSREHGDEGNTGGKGGTGSETSHDKGSGDNEGNGDDEGSGRHNELESLGGSGTSPSQASSKKFFQAVAGSTGGANSTDPSNTATPTDEYGSPLPNPTSLPPGSDSSDSSDGTVVGGGRPSTGVIIAIVGGVLAGLAVLLVLAWLGHRAWKRREEKRLMTTEKSAIPPLFSSESFLAPPPLPTPGTAVHNTSTLVFREKGLTKPPTHPFTSIHEADSSTAVHEMPSPMPQTIGNRHELATPDILEIPDFGDIDLDMTDHEDDGDDLGIRRPTSML
ncbi:hypothetical protein QC761_301940 [Podospora bellae-mahoneyi]|uniref:Mid2 domain-containing protein n=1 Tax=Podospora bellae-mahoneyi TaxID=2093777 RepID=A0ABR0FJI2_9PEZI|nr:hypothetical protein QC761_301940 [Podospora bellae-mahoneyi]